MPQHSAEVTCKIKIKKELINIKVAWWFYMRLIYFAVLVLRLIAFSFVLGHWSSFLTIGDCKIKDKALITIKIVLQLLREYIRKYPSIFDDGNIGKPIIRTWLETDNEDAMNYVYKKEPWLA